MDIIENVISKICNLADELATEEYVAQILSILPNLRDKSVREFLEERNSLESYGLILATYYEMERDPSIIDDTTSNMKTVLLRYLRRLIPSREGSEVHLWYTMSRLVNILEKS